MGGALRLRSPPKGGGTGRKSRGALVVSGRIKVSTLITKDALRAVMATAWCRDCSPTLSSAGEMGRGLAED